MRRAVVTGVVAVLGAAALVAIPVAVASSAAESDPGRGTHVTPEQAVATANAALRAHRAQFAATANDKFSVFRTIVDANGASHVRYTRTYKGLRVYGGDIVVHLRSDGSLEGTSVGLAKPLNLTITPQVTATKAAAAARHAFTGSIRSVGNPKLIVDASSGTGRLAYETVVDGLAADGKTPSVLHVRTDALSGTIVGSADDVKHVDGTGNSLYAGTVTISTTDIGGAYTLTDATHGNGYTCDMNNGTSTCSTMNDADNTWGDSTNSSDQSAAVDAHYGAALTFDYFKNVHGRNGIFGNGAGVPSRVHYGNGYVNAFWDGTQMTYGDGAGNAKPLTSIDVAGHEMTHGVTENVVPGGLPPDNCSPFSCWGESGGLNEATSDIFGTMVEFYAANATDQADYDIGEKIDINGDGTPLRYMYNPSLDGASDSCWSIDTKNEDVHFSSGVANHFFFMLAEGSGVTPYGISPTCDGGPAVPAIGRTDAAAIWFKALDQYFTATTRYVNNAVPTNTARSYTLAAASDVYGLCSTQYQAVQRAWTAVNVAGSDVGCNDTPGAFVSLPPTRILDTRYGTGAPAGKVSAGGVLEVDIAGHGGVPDNGAAAVVLNVTVTQPGAGGYLTVFPSGQAPPLASNLNFMTGQTIPNLVTVKLGGNGHLSFKNGSLGGVHVLADVAGFFLAGEASSPGAFVPLSPTRLLDTRIGTGAPAGKVAGNGVLALQVTGAGGVPLTGVSAVVLNVTVTQPGSSGYITVFPTGTTAPLASNLNFTAGQTIPNLVIVKLGTGGKVSLKNTSSAGSHLIADVAGYYLTGTPTEPGTFVSLAPSRVLDTRNGTGAPVGKVAGFGELNLVVAGHGGVPLTGAIAVVLNVTVTQPGSSGYITVFPTGGDPPLASNLNFTAGLTIPNLVTVQLGDNGAVTFLNGSSAGSHLVADIAGYYLA